MAACALVRSAATAVLRDYNVTRSHHKISSGAAAGSRSRLPGLRGAGRVQQQGQWILLDVQEKVGGMQQQLQDMDNRLQQQLKNIDVRLQEVDTRLERIEGFVSPKASTMSTGMMAGVVILYLMYTKM